MEDTHENNYKSALKVNEGIPQPPSLNEGAAKHFSKRVERERDSSYYVKGILTGNRTILSQAITLIESALPGHQKQAAEIITQCLPHAGNSVRIGITGVPGVGKSTFIEAFGTYLIQSRHRIAVLAIDPSSSRSKGSILGDKTRMESLSVDSNAFIRPSPSAGSLGGVARKTRETIILCEAAGYDTIFVETVGVGQSETAVHSMVDFFLLLMLGGAGDELQGIKRGIMEMADAVIINKADGDNLTRVNIAKAELRSALHYFPPSDSGWKPVCESCSSLSNQGMDKVAEIVDEYVRFTRNSGYFSLRRKLQSKQIMTSMIEEELYSRFYANPEIIEIVSEYETDIAAGKISPYQAARQLLDLYFGQVKR
jgi:LAO/AO transport system kinase